MGEKFGARLKELREEKGMTQLEVAYKAGVSISAVSYLEMGHKSPNIRTLVRIAKALGELPAQLLALYEENDGGADE